MHHNHGSFGILTCNLDIIPVIMAGIIGIYGLVVAVLISNSLGQGVTLFASFIQLGELFSPID
jgi:ATP synthase proteolipid subunit